MSRRRNRRRARTICCGHVGGSYRPFEPEPGWPPGYTEPIRRRHHWADSRVNWQFDYQDDSLGLDRALETPFPYEQYANGEEMFPSRIGLWRDAVVTCDWAVDARRCAAYSHRDVFRRKDMLRVEPIRTRRRFAKLHKEKLN